jgi:transposase
MKKYQEQLKELRNKMYSVRELSLQFNISTSHLYNLINGKKEAGFELKGKIDRLYNLTFAPEQKPKYKNRLHNKISVIINTYFPVIIVLGVMTLSLYLLINLF